MTVSTTHKPSSLPMAVMAPLLALAMAACSGEGGTWVESEEGAAGANDPGTTDAGANDSGTGDTGASDAGASDTGFALGCERGGCSGQLCTEPGSGIVTTCEWRSEYACYAAAICERQPEGVCGWTMTEELKQCLGGGSVLSL